MNIFIVLLIAVIGIAVIRALWRKNDWIKPSKPFSAQWRAILAEKVGFYNSLSQEEKTQFEYKIQEFLLNCRITGIDTTVDLTDKLLVASSAVIPIFAFPDWKYTNLFEVLLYPGSFNEKHETAGKDNRILGMVGTGYLEGKMILSKPSLYHGFANESDKRNTAIHEFVHLIDKSDGATDGIPKLLLERQYTIPWLELINKKIEEIYDQKSDINPYGGTNRAEFYSVASEYFFERPKLLAKKHPELYRLMEEIFNQDMSKRNLNKKKQSIGRNDPCPCGSGLKFKKCCGKVHYN
jgi:Mlc titration factor MtfA (ptsG expression regulator)